MLPSEDVHFFSILSLLISGIATKIGWAPSPNPVIFFHSSDDIKTKEDDKFHNLRMSFIEDLKEVKYVNVCQPLKKEEKKLLEEQLSNE